MNLSLLAAAVGLAVWPPFAGAAPVAPARVVVTYDHPENFTDVQDAALPTDRGRDAILGNITQFLQDRGRDWLPPGYTLAITFTDIKLAGEFEPWRGPNWSQVRIVTGAYPPFFKFSYTLTDPSGRVVKQGREDLTDLNFQLRVAEPLDDPLRYEKSILGDWMQGLKDRLPA